MRKHRILPTSISLLSVAQSLLMLVLSLGIYVSLPTSSAHAATYCQIYPTNPSCGNYATYCATNATDRNCVGFNTICPMAAPNDPVCFGFTQYCSGSGATSERCMGDAYCGVDPSAARCSDVDHKNFCQSNPDHAYCAGFKSFCDTSPNDSYCKGVSSLCSINALAPDCVGMTAYCKNNPNDTQCFHSSAEFCSVYSSDSRCSTGQSLFCAANPNDVSCPGSEAFCALSFHKSYPACKAATFCNTYPNALDCGNYAAYCVANPQDENCVGFSTFCSTAAADHRDCFGYSAYCSGSGATSHECMGDAYCGAHPGDPTCNDLAHKNFCQSNPNDVNCAGWKTYCQSADPTYTPCAGIAQICTKHPEYVGCIGRNTYCLNNPNAEDCFHSSAEYCGVYAASPRCKPGADMFCAANPNDVSCPGSAAFCALNTGDVSCPGSEAFCKLAANSNSDKCPGTAAYCALPGNQFQPGCGIGSATYCADPAHTGEDVCKPGTQAYCTSGYHSNDPTCPGSAAFCADPANSNSDRCPGTVSYCTKFPYDPLCKVVTDPTNNGPLPYSVLETSKSTGVGRALCNMVYYTKSSVARSLSALSIIILAIAAMFGKISWGNVIMVALGIAAVFGASQLSVFIGSHVSGLDAVLACLKGD